MSNLIVSPDNRPQIGNEIGPKPSKTAAVAAVLAAAYPSFTADSDTPVKLLTRQTGFAGHTRNEADIRQLNFIGGFTA